MTARKKVGIGLGISGGAFLLAGIVAFFTTADPSWLEPVLNIVGLVAGALGFKVVLPDTEE